MISESLLISHVLTSRGLLPWSSGKMVFFTLRLCSCLSGFNQNMAEEHSTMKFRYETTAKKYIVV